MCRCCTDDAIVVGCPDDEMGGKAPLVNVSNMMAVSATSCTVPHLCTYLFFYLKVLWTYLLYLDRKTWACTRPLKRLHPILDYFRGGIMGKDV